MAEILLAMGYKKKLTTTYIKGQSSSKGDITVIKRKSISSHHGKHQCIYLYTYSI